MRPLLAIAANDVDQSGILVEQVLPEAWISARLGEESYRASGDGRFWGRLSRSGRSEIIVRGSVTVDVELPCARCLRPTASSVRGEVSLLLKERPGAAEFSRIGERWPAREKQPKAHRAAEYEFTSEEADVDEYDGEVVILDDFIREAILLELPNFPLCSESCTGIWPDLVDAVRGPGSEPARTVVEESRDAADGNTQRETVGRLARHPFGTESRSHGKSRGTNPFEALLHLRPSLAKGIEAGPLEDTPPTPQPINPIVAHRERKAVTKAAVTKATKTKKHDKRLSSTHASPGRHTSAKKARRAEKKSKRP